MRIDSLNLRNYKGFRTREFSFHPQFNLVVGENGTGKTSLLDALSIAVGSWFLGVRGFDTRHIRATEVSLESFEKNANGNGGSRRTSVHWESQYPCVVEATGEVLGHYLTWARQLNTPHGRTTYVDARNIKALAEETDQKVRTGDEVLLPLISYYGTGRLWEVPREQAQIRDEREVTSKETLSRLAGYRNSVDPRLSISELVRWIARQSWITYQQDGQEPFVYVAVRDAIMQSLEGARDIYFDAEVGEVIVEVETQGKQPFNNLSDGQRCMLAMVGDIAQKAATLNPQSGSEVLKQTPGVVLIDELDLHLHPKWQRHVIEDLRAAFPRIQFIATTHSPFLIQSLRSGEELMVLGGEATANLNNLGIETIAAGIMGVTDPEVSPRYLHMLTAAREYLVELDEAAKSPRDRLDAFQQQLAARIAPFADNPAFQAVLEAERSAKLGV